MPIPRIRVRTLMSARARLFKIAKRIYIYYGSIQISFGVIEIQAFGHAQGHEKGGHGHASITHIF